MANSNRGRITYGLRIAIFSVVEVENRHFQPRYCDCRPLAEERPAIYQRNLCIADSTGLSSFVLPLLPLKSAKACEIPRKFEFIEVQGHQPCCQSKAHMQVPISH